MKNNFVWIPILTYFIALQTKNLLQAQAKVLPGSDIDILIYKTNSSNNETSYNGTRFDRQFAGQEIDVDGPYGYVPKVVNGINKIVKGLLNGSIHQVMHGAFGFAPDDVADDLIGTYNQVMGIPDPEDLDLDSDETTEKTTKSSASKNKVSAKPGQNLKDTVVTLGVTGKSVNGKKPVKKKNDEEEDDIALEEEDDDDFDPLFLLMNLQ